MTEQLSLLEQEARRRLRLARMKAAELREAFQAEASQQIGENIFIGEPKKLEDQLRWLNLNYFLQCFHLSMPEVVQILLDLHYRKIPGRRGLGIGAAQLFGPSSRERFAQLAQERYPDASERLANEVATQTVAVAIDESPLDFGLPSLVSNYRKRLHQMSKMRELLKRRYRRPYRGSPWKAV